MNRSETERLEAATRRVWFALHRGDDPDLSQHEREVLHHVVPGRASLSWLARHLGLPKSTASVLVKDLARRGFLRRRRDRADERRLAIELTEKGRRRVKADTLYDPDRLAVAMAGLSPSRARVLVESLEMLAEAAEEARPGQRARA